MSSIQGGSGNLGSIQDNCMLPVDPNNTGMLFDGGSGYSVRDGTTTIHGGDSNDNIHVHINCDGSVDATINGHKIHFTAEQAKNLNIQGGKGNDNITVTGHQLFGPEKSINIDGGFGDDVIHGSSASENISGGAGNDIIVAGAGDDKIDGGVGDDTIWGGSGNDSIIGGYGDDRLIGNEGDDTIRGGWGNDTIWGSAGNDTLTGDFGADKLIGGSGNDTLRGLAGEDSYWGGSGADRLVIGTNDRVVIPGCDSGDVVVKTDDDERLYAFQSAENSPQAKTEESSSNKLNPFDPLLLFNLISAK